MKYQDQITTNKVKRTEYAMFHPLSLRGCLLGCFCLWLFRLKLVKLMIRDKPNR